jgi:hypothetical protein
MIKNLKAILNEDRVQEENIADTWKEKKDEEIIEYIKSKFFEKVGYVKYIKFIYH